MPLLMFADYAALPDLLYATPALFRLIDTPVAAFATFL